MGLPADGTSVALPASDKVGSAFSSELAKAVNAEFQARLAVLGPLPTSGLAATTALNKRGVLFGKFGRYDDAFRDFQAAAKGGSISALVNLGNISMLKADPMSAYGYYQQAAKQVTGNVGLYVNLARAAAALGKSDAAAAALDNVRKLDPKMADKYAQLAQVGSNGTRAAEVEGNQVIWF
jgi:tetratricopeptide (TPR) repeat protein